MPIREYHKPVLADEVLEYLDPRPGMTMVDCTLGGGGHAALLGERLQPDGTLIGIDQDIDAIEASRARFGSLSLAVVILNGNYRDMKSLLAGAGITAVNGLLLDLGVSSHQFDDATRGFSFRADAPLDMRMNASAGETAADLVARLSEREITRILLEYGEERWAARIARFITAERDRKPIVSTGQLADLVAAAIPMKARPRDIHPATRVFQALRIAVNDELAALEKALRDGAELLVSGGRIAVISFHSLEDRIVKRHFARLAGRCECPPGLPECRCGASQVVRLLTRKPVTPTASETRDNPRARSAKLRVAERV